MKEIIIIDDDHVNNYICEILIKSVFPNLNVRCIEDSIEALSVLSESVVDPETTILLDLNLPQMDGWAFLEKFKKKNIKCNLFILTSSINPIDMERTEKDSFVKGYLIKPLTVESIRLVFQDHVGWIGNW
jgi:CheY-like chemotaxis protein